MKHEFERYCKDYEKIENYEKAAADNFKGWHCHHRLETHTSEGERRLVNIPQAELKSSGMYYHRPAEELIFLTSREHGAYNKGKRHSAETRRKIAEAHEGKYHSEEAKKKMSEAKKEKYAGENNPMYGKHHSDETKKKLSKPKSEEAKNKMSEAWDYDKHFTMETRKKLSEAQTGRHWYNNGEKEAFSKECPPGFVPGRLRK